ncbi:MAG: carbohydrate-binding domain-containing protein [Clostridia bacterium]|nr:carbohydrate-binding domain-containing protein [Clostridia bacterium]
MKRLLSLLLTLTMLLTLAACGGDTAPSADQIGSSDSPGLTEWDMHAHSVDLTDLYPDAVFVEISDAADTAGITVTNDIVYYEAGRDFTYGEGTAADEHTAEEAAAHTVVTITEPGTYVLSGKLEAGQIAVDLGEDAEEDPDAVVTLVLNGVDITCTVAPAVIFYNVYECGSTDSDSATYEVNTAAAGANVVIADGTVNNVRGSYVARIYKSVELSEDGTEVIDSKKLHKYDGAFYSKMSMNINGGTMGTGTLNIKAENEGLDTELHLTVNGGQINILSGNDGINTNEDGVSVTTINGGTLNIRCDGSTGEGDGIDSNGWLVINDGAVYAQACATSGDAGIDSDLGIYINGGAVMASGNMLDVIAGGNATYAVFEFAQPVEGGKSVDLTDANGGLLMMYTAENAYRYLIVSLNTMAAGDYTLWLDEVQMAHSGAMGGMGFGGRGGMGGERPEGLELPEDFDPSQMQIPDRGEMPENFDFSQMRDEEIPEGFDPSQMDGLQRPEGMEGMIPPDGEMPQRFENGMGFEGRGQGGISEGEQSAVFTIADGGNRFSGVSAYRTAE